MKPNDRPSQMAPEDQGAGTRRKYVTPAIQCFHEDEILAIIGPAQAYNGDLPGVDKPF